MAHATLEYLERAATGGWMLRFLANDYSFEEIKDEIKSLPRIDRYWNSRALNGRGAWWVSDYGLSKVQSLFWNYQEMRERADRTQHNTHTHDERRSYGSSSGSSAPTTREKAFATLFLLPNAPKEVAQAVHRVLAKMHHPDHGGDLEKMKQINLAYEVVEASYPKEGR